MGIAMSMKSGYETIHWNVCIPPIEIPTTPLTCFRLRVLVSSSCCDSTVSRRVNWGKFILGCCELFDGEDETPLLNASIATTKYLLLSRSFPGPILDCSCSVV